MPEAFAARDKGGLGLTHVEISDGVIDLVNEGVLTNARKTLHPGKIIAGFMLGTHELYKWSDDNALIEMHRTEYVNDPFVIAQNERMVAINAARALIGTPERRASGRSAGGVSSPRRSKALSPRCSVR